MAAATTENVNKGPIEEGVLLNSSVRLLRNTIHSVEFKYQPLWLVLPRLTINRDSRDKFNR